MEKKELKDVYVFQLCECDAVAAYSLDEAKAWYKELTGLNDEELYADEDVELVSFDYQVRKSEEDSNLISVREIIDTYWKDKPFIVFSSMH